MTKFTPSVWREQGERLRTAADEFYRSAHGVQTAAYANGGSSPIDSTAADRDRECQDTWHHVVAAAYETMTSAASGMEATGSQYKAAEEHAASQRFWED